MSEEFMYDYSDHGGPVFTGPLAPFDARAYKLAFLLCFGSQDEGQQRVWQDELDGVMDQLIEMRAQGLDRVRVKYPHGRKSPVIVDRTSKTAFEAAQEPIRFSSPELEDLGRRIEAAKKRQAERFVYVLR